MSAIIFDFDGTIADSFPVVLELLDELTHGKVKLDAEQIERLRGMSLLPAARMIGVSPLKMLYLLWRGRRRMRSKVSQIKTHPGIPAVVRKLYDEGHQLFVLSSNSRRNINPFLRQHQMKKEFVAVYDGAGLFSKAKALRKVIKRNSLDVQTTWYVGDEIKDIVGAHEAGIKIAAVSWGYNNADILRQHNPTHLVTTPAELLSILEEA